MTYPPKVKVTKLSQLRKTTLLLHEFTCIFSTYWLMNYSISWCILQENSIPRSMNGESCGYDLCGGHSIFLNDIPPKIKVTKLSRLGKEIIATRVYMHFFTIFINKLQYIVMYSSNQFNSLFNEGRIVWLRLLLETQPLFEWHTPQLRKKSLLHEFTCIFYHIN